MCDCRVFFLPLEVIIFPQKYIGMVKKTLFSLGCLLAVLVFGTSEAKALSPIQFGVKAGIQGQGMTLKSNDVLNMLSTDGNLGYNLGVMSRISMGLVYVQPELVYGWNQFRMEGPENTSAKFSVKNVEVPVLLGFKVLFVRLMLGPTFNLLNETKVKSSNLPADFHTDVHKPTVGFQLGAGVEFGGFNIDIRYAGQFKRSYQNIAYGNLVDQVKTSINAWQINLGYFF